ncbi:MAG: hypothetical protein H6840_06655 [Planctomycetes bacterium]|nr:hypothetical protein [Planctomycetota bacterium]
MPRERRNQRAYAGLLACLLLGTVFVLGIGGLAWIGEAAEVGPARMLLVSLMVLGLRPAHGRDGVLVPYGVHRGGRWLRLRDQKRDELAALPDDNTVGDPDGQRKLHEYLTAINSTEARIGLLQRSEPWLGESPPDVAKGPIWRLSPSARTMVQICIVAGFVLGLTLGTARIAATDAEELSVTLKRTLLVHLVVSGLLGALFAAPLGWIAVLLFGKTERVESTQAEEEDDTGRSGPETA